MHDGGVDPSLIPEGWTLAEMLALRGADKPTHRCGPAWEISDIDLALKIAEAMRLKLDPAQVEFLADVLARKETPYGEKWAAFEAAIECSRQNGKTVIFALRIIIGLFVYRERLIVYTAHKGETAMETYAFVCELINRVPEFRREVKITRKANGKEEIELKPSSTEVEAWEAGSRDEFEDDEPDAGPRGPRAKFRTRTAGGGRGLTGDLVILDEAQDLREMHISALMPVMFAKTIEGDPQIIYGGSAGGPQSTILGALVARCERKDPTLIMHRYAADEDDDLGSPAVWAKTNPAIGRRASIFHVAKEFNSMPRSAFAAERCGIGNYPRQDGEEWVIPRRAWEAALDAESAPRGPVAFAIEVNWSRTRAAIAVAGRRADGSTHIEIVAEELGMRWCIQALAILLRNPDALGVVADPRSPAAGLLSELKDAGAEATLLTTADMTTAFAKFFSGLTGDVPTIRHRGGTALTQSLAEAQLRNVGGAQTWKRIGSESGAPVMAATWAVHALSILTAMRKPPPAAPRLLARPTRSELASTAF